MKKKRACDMFRTSAYSLTGAVSLPLDEKVSCFNANLPASKAVRLILLKFYINMLFYRDRLLQSDEEEDLHQLRVNIRKSRAFIKSFATLFKNDLDQLLLKQLSKIATQTNKKRDLDVMQAQLQKSLQTDKQIYDEIQAQGAKERKKIDAMLKSQTLESFLSSYRSILLESDHLFIKHKKEMKIKQCAKRAILKLHENLQERISKLEKNFSVEKLHKIRIGFKKLRYLLEEFQHIFDTEHITSDIKQMKTLQTLLGDFNDTINQKKLINEYVKIKKKKSNRSYDDLFKLTSEKEQLLIREVLDALEQYKTKTLRF